MYLKRWMHADDTILKQSNASRPWDVDQCRSWAVFIITLCYLICAGRAILTLFVLQAINVIDC